MRINNQFEKWCKCKFFNYKNLCQNLLSFKSENTKNYDPQYILVFFPWLKMSEAYRKIIFNFDTPNNSRMEAVESSFWTPVFVFPKQRFRARKLNLILKIVIDCHLISKEQLFYIAILKFWLLLITFAKDMNEST